MSIPPLTSFTEVAFRNPPSTNSWYLIDEFIRKRGLENTFNKKVVSPMEASIYLNDLELCQKVAKLQGGFLLQYDFERSLLYAALWVEDESIALWIIEEGMDIHLRNSQGLSYLHIAAQIGKINVAKVLVEKGLLVDSVASLLFPTLPESFAELKAPLMICTPLYLAVFYHQKEMVEWLLTNGADGNKGTSVCTPFLLAFLHNFEDMLPLFNKTNFNIDGACLSGIPLLHYFVEEQNEVWVKKLLDIGANPNIRDQEEGLPLNIAILLKQDKIAKLLMENGADLNAQMDGESPLYACCEANAVELVQYLLEKKVNPNIPDKHANTPLHISILSVHDECVKLLLEHSADVNTSDEKGETPLHDAVLVGNETFVKMLLEKGASVNVPNAEGETPLHYAMTEGMVKILLDAGAEARVINDIGMTPLGNIKSQTSYTKEKFLDLQKLDEGLTEMMINIKLLGHRFSIKGKWMENFSPAFTYREMGISLQEFLPSLPLDLQSGLQQLPALFLKSAKFNFNQKNTFESFLLQWRDQGDWLILPLTWKEHNVSLIMKNRYVIRGNCGEGAKKTGLTIFEIPKKEANHPIAEVENRVINDKSYQGLIELIEILSRRVHVNELDLENTHKDLDKKYKQEAIQYFNHTMIDTMSLNKLDDLNLKNQKVGNCTWKAAKLSFRSALIIYFFEQTGDLKKAMRLAKKIYEQWKIFDYKKGLKQFAEINKDPVIEKNGISDNIFPELFKACAKNKNSHLTKFFIELFPEFLLWKDPKTGETALQLAKDTDTL